jgi:glycosyltransferase involved in cell wall biosynthesis
MMLSRGPDDYMERLELPRGGTKLQGRWDRLQRYQNPGNYNVIPHGHTPGIFEPRDQTEARELLGIPRDAFVVLNVATNSPRKRLDLTIRAFARLAHLRKEAILVIHCNGGGGTNGWDLTSAAHYYGVADRVILTHLLYPNLSDDQLCWLYNTADIQVNTSGGEGWSLCSFEGAECGLPQLVPDWSATRELWGQHGYLIPVKDTRMEPKFLNTVHACIDTQALGDRMVELADNQFERASMSDLALQRASLQHSWDSVGEAFSSVIQHALSEPVPQPVSFNELNAARIGHITSEGSLG